MSKWGSSSSIGLINGSLRANATHGNGTPGVFISVPYGHLGVQTFCAVIVPFICALGIVGNTLSFILLKQSARRVSSHFYLCCLSVADSVTLVSIMLSIWLGVIMQGYYYLIGQASPTNWVWVATGICWFSQLRIYLSYLCRMVSVWLIVVLSVERCISVLSPLKWGTRLCTVRNGVIAVGALCGVSALFNIYVIFGYELKHMGKQHRCVPNQHFFIGRVVGNVVLSVVPWVIICVANGLLVVVMRRRNRRAGAGLDHHQSSSRQERQERNVTLRLLTISGAFLLFTLPMTITGTINTWHEMNDSNAHKTGALADAWLISFVLFTCNFACNFLLYCFTGKNFRRAALALLLCRIKRMDRLAEQIDRSGSGSQSAGAGTQTVSGGSFGAGNNNCSVTAPILRSDSSASRTNDTNLSREPSDMSARQQAESAAKQRLLRKETRI